MRDIPGESPIDDMNRFRQICKPLSSCISDVVELTRKQGRSRNDDNPKWKKGLQEQYQILGQARVGNQIDMISFRVLILKQFLMNSFWGADVLNSVIRIPPGFTMSHHVIPEGQGGCTFAADCKAPHHSQ